MEKAKMLRICVLGAVQFVAIYLAAIVGIFCICALQSGIDEALLSAVAFLTVGSLIGGSVLGIIFTYTYVKYRWIGCVVVYLLCLAIIQTPYPYDLLFLVLDATTGRLF